MKKAFTLAEVLIILAIIGIVAAITIPSVVVNYKQTQFKTGLKKAISSLNTSIQLSIAQDNDSPYTNDDLFNYLKKNMNVLRTRNLSYNNVKDGNWWAYVVRNDGTRVYQNNHSFYTQDGMRYEIPSAQYDNWDLRLKLHETSEVRACSRHVRKYYSWKGCGGCGSYGLKNNPYNTTKPLCVIMVDVNGDKKPHPSNLNCRHQSCSLIKYPAPNSKHVIDLFTIMITEDKAAPFGVLAQRMMYENK